MQGPSHVTTPPYRALSPADIGGAEGVVTAHAVPPCLADPAVETVVEVNLNGAAPTTVVFTVPPAPAQASACVIEEIVEAPNVVQPPTNIAPAPVLPAKTPRRRGARRNMVPLDVTSLRRSKRLNPDLQGFRDAASVAELGGQGQRDQVGGGASSSSAPPHLSVENIQAIGHGFCKMDPADVSEEALNKSDSDDE
ncbi:hypothetical protein ACP70R_000277 [Stipagrostis hirtigluma subsp. patula]